MDNQLFKTLQNSNLLKNTDFSKLNFENVTGKLVSLNEGEILYQENDPSESVFIIVSGQMNLLTEGESGSTESLVYSDNDFIGLNELIENANRRSTTVALDDSYLIELSKEELTELITQDPDILLNPEVSLPEDLKTEYLRSIGIDPAKIEDTEEEPIFDEEDYQEEDGSPETETPVEEENLDYDSDAIIDQYESSPPDNEEDSLTKDLIELDTLQNQEEAAQEEKEEETGQEDQESTDAEQEESSIKKEDTYPEDEKEDYELETGQQDEIEEDNEPENYEGQEETGIHENDEEEKFIQGFEEDFNLEDLEATPQEEDQENNEDHIPDYSADFEEETEESIDFPELPDEYYEEEVPEVEASESKEDEEPSEESEQDIYETTDSEENTKEPFERIDEESGQESQQADEDELTDTKDETEFYEYIQEPEEVDQEEEPEPETDEGKESSSNDVPYFLTEDYAEETEYADEEEEGYYDNYELETTEPDEPAKEEVLQIFDHLRTINSSLRLEDLSDDIVTSMVELCNAAKGLLFHTDRDKEELWTKIHENDKTKIVQIPIGEGIIGWSGKYGKVVNEKNPTEDERFRAEYDNLYNLELSSLLCYPVKDHEDNVISVLQLVNSTKGEFSIKDENILEIFMKVASVSIDNARHVEELLRNERIASLGKMSNLLIEDIKKPILISKRYTEHLLKKDLEKDIYNILEMMLEQLEGVGDVVQSVSSYSEGKTMLRNVNVNLNELLNDFTQRIKYFVENKNCKIENDLSTDVSVSIDIREFYQVFDKIVKNAVESMPEGGKVTVSTEVKEDYVNINFQDEGVGIPEEVINKVYEPFMSYGKSMNTGLGLSIAKKIVAAHNGELKIESETGKGTKVQIVLPVADEF